MHVFDLDTHFLKIVSQVFSHLLSQSCYKDTLAFFSTAINFTKEVIHLTHSWTNFDFWIKKPCRTDDLLNHSLGLFHLIVARSSRNIYNLMYMTLEFFTSKRTVIKRRWQTETVINQHLLTSLVSVIHSLNLTHCHVTFINHDEEVFWEEIKQGERWLALFSPIHVS